MSMVQMSSLLGSVVLAGRGLRQGWQQWCPLHYPVKLFSNIFPESWNERIISHNNPLSSITANLSGQMTGDKFPRTITNIGSISRHQVTSCWCCFLSCCFSSVASAPSTNFLGTTYRTRYSHQSRKYPYNSKLKYKLNCKLNFTSPQYIHRGCSSI